ncbi:alpha/beta hydrolase [Palleronia sp. LCG004]|uniref:alpha/beta hydrolase n=1 Tax=Palleronia sp. LCG004 TaxID=3079304 RepID=UPI0029438F26|nr:alpha/beta hydrolase [Palleronia sp. LCG004]WOI57290.1 alpha/beta hydrolase [Palleronia sp. LCG004]
MLPAPLHDDIADGPEGGQAHWVEAQDGLRLRVGHWRNPEGRGTVLLLPGRTEYIEKYGPAAVELGRIGLSVISIDWRGQGLTERMLGDPMGGHIRRFRDFQMDLEALAKAAEDLDLPRPWHLLGHSMGGAIGLRGLSEGFDVASAAFSSPMWGIGLSSALRPMAWALSWAARGLSLDHLYAPGTSASSYPNAAGFEGNFLTCDDVQYAWMAHQVERHPELGLGGPSLRWLHEALRECRLLSRKPAPEIPCAVVLGTAERLVDPVVIRDRMKEWREGTLHMIDGGRHETMMETPERRTRVFNILRAHFEAHSAPTR